MKMKPEDYAIMEEGLDKLVTKAGLKIEEHFEKLANDPKVKDLGMRFRWDLFNSSLGNTSEIEVSTLYSYLNDAQIDTALKKYIDSRPQLKSLLDEHMKSVKTNKSQKEIIANRIAAELRKIAKNIIEEENRAKLTEIYNQLSQAYEEIHSHSSPVDNTLLKGINMLGKAIDDLSKMIE